jgi:hypothetical protein
VLEASKAIEDEGLARGFTGSAFLVKEQAVSSQLLAQPLDRAVRDSDLSSDLAESGAGHESVEDGLEELGATEPVAAFERL